MTRDNMKKTLSENLVEVIFTKKNGEQRIMKCTTMTDMIPESSRPTTKTTAKENTDVVVAYDIEKSDWRSFRVDSVTSFNMVSKS